MDASYAGKPCPKCMYVRTATDTAPNWQCPKCGIAYAKFAQSAPSASPPASPASPPAPAPSIYREGDMDPIEFKIYGAEMQFVEIELERNQAAIGEAGSLFYMEDGIEMETQFGDGSGRQLGVMDKVLSAGKRVMTGESLFVTTFTNWRAEKRKVAFAAPYPGKIIPIDLAKIGGKFVCQKEAFLCGAKGVSLGVAFQKSIHSGFFGGLGFIMQKLEGNGKVFVHAGGTMHQRKLQPFETLRVDTGCVVGFQESVNFDINYVGSIKTMLFSGEGIFFATLRGPGTVILQSLPFSRFASKIFALAPSTSERGSSSLVDLAGGLVAGRGSAAGAAGAAATGIAAGSGGLSLSDEPDRTVEGTEQDNEGKGLLGTLGGTIGSFFSRDSENNSDSDSSSREDP